MVSCCNVSAILIFGLVRRVFEEVDDRLSDEIVGRMVPPEVKLWGYRYWLVHETGVLLGCVRGLGLAIAGSSRDREQ